MSFIKFGKVRIALNNVYVKDFKNRIQSILDYKRKS